MGLAGHDAAVSGVCRRAYILAVTQAGVPRLRCHQSAASIGLQPFVNQKCTLLIKKKRAGLTVIPSLLTHST